MASKAKSGLSAVRQFSEWVDDPALISFTAGQTNFVGKTRDGKGHGSFHVALRNNTTGTLRIYMGWTSTTMEVVDEITTVADPVSGNFTAGTVMPIVKRYVRAEFIGTVGADFEQGSYFLPRASIQFEAAGGAITTPVGTTGDFDNAAEDETQTVQLVRAALTAHDSSEAANVRNVVVNAGQALDSSLTDTNRGILTLSKLFAERRADSVVGQVSGDFASGTDGVAIASAMGLYTHAIAHGIDSTGAAVLRPVEARNLNSDADVAQSLVGLLVNSRLSVRNVGDTSEYARVGGISESVGGLQAAFSTDIRQDGFVSSVRGRRFTVTPPAGTSITGTTSFTATAPQILLEAGATNDLVLRNLTFSLVTAAGADPVRIHGVIDPDARYSSGGTSRTPSNMNTTSVVASTAAQVRDGAITATAADGDERDIFDIVISNSIGASVSIDFKDGLIIGVSDTFLGYVQGGSSAPTFTYSYEFEDANVQ